AADEGRPILQRIRPHEQPLERMAVDPLPGVLLHTPFDEGLGIYGRVGYFRDAGVDELVTAIPVEQDMRRGWRRNGPPLDADPAQVIGPLRPEPIQHPAPYPLEQSILPFRRRRQPSTADHGR